MKLRVNAACISLIFLLFWSGNSYALNEAGQVASQSNLSKSLAETAGEVILEAAEFGLDWAGEKFLGSKGWSGFKKILKPVVKRLQERFPALKFGKGDDPSAKRAAQEAVNYLQQDPQLHNLLMQGFNNLEQGHVEILSSINRLSKLLEASHDEQVRLLRQMDEKLDNVGGLPVNVDVSDTVDRAYLLSKARARQEGREFDQNVSGFIAVNAGMGVFALRVLEDGKAFVRYVTDMGKAKWYATPSGQFTDNGSRLCRKLSTDVPVWGVPGKRRTSSSKNCQIDGGWEQVELIEQSEYFE